jgi:hypothetical protein
LVAIVAIMASLGIRLRGPRLVAFSMMLFFDLSHIRGLLMFFLLAPIILARLILARAAWLRATHRVEGQLSETTRTADPVLSYLQERPLVMPAIVLGLAAIVTAHSWHKINVDLPKSISPSAAIEFMHAQVSPEMSSIAIHLAAISFSWAFQRLLMEGYHHIQMTSYGDTLML